MEHRHLGRSGMVVSAISYGNWITHGNQVEEDAAAACVRAALDAGSPPSTPRRLRQRRSRRGARRALHGVRRDSIEIFTKVYWPTGPNPNNRGLSRKHIIESAEASLSAWAPTTSTSSRRTVTTTRHPRRDPAGVRRPRACRKVHYIGVSEWTADQIADAVRIADQMGLDRIVSNQPSTRCSGG